MILSADQIQKIDSIYNKLSLGDWYGATFTAGAVLDSILGKIQKDIMAATPIDPAAKTGGKDNRRKQELTLGQRIHLFKDENYFEQYEMILGKPLPNFKTMNWERVLDIRNRCAHPDDTAITPSEAYEITSYLYLLLIELTDWSPKRTLTPARKLLYSGKFLWAALFIFAMLVSYFIFNYFSVIKPINQTIDKYGKEIATVLEQGRDYKLAAWFMERDESVPYRDTELYRLNIKYAQQVEEENAYVAYTSYRKALKLCNTSKESILCDKKYIEKHMGELLERMTPLNRFWVRFGVAAVILGAIFLWITGSVVSGRRKRRKL